MIYYVSCGAGRDGDGTKDLPFRRIQDAAELAGPGDEVVVSPGIYREYVNPKRGGTAQKPIVYRAEVMGESLITGGEPVKNWKPHKGDVWSARIPNGVFGNYNPYTTVIYGDWYYTKEAFHTGEVYLNGKAMYERASLEAVEDPKVFEPSNDKEFSLYQWYTCQEKDATVIYANFHGMDPNEEDVEINVRRNCFYPDRTGIDYITLRGFSVSKAATTWAPPTAYQEGMVGPHWSKGWVIEDCEISHSKCVGISLGKYLQPNNENKWSKFRLKQGTQTERDAICQAQAEGWTKERIGSHIIRRCHIHDCGQAGIVGHLGCVFSVIEDNHIHHINWRHMLSGAEIGGIKLHAAIDTQIIRNHIHHCTRGLWLDWQAQGTRVSQNLFHHNFPPEGTVKFQMPLDIGEDLFVEVSHGPTLIDHNLMLSPQACRLATQGTAFVHNLICGSFTSVGEGTNNVSGTETISAGSGKVADPGPRYTPYHMPHRTEVAGFMTILHGDNRFYNNIFVQADKPGVHDCLFETFPVKAQNSVAGTAPFDDYPTEKEYLDLFFREGDEGAAEDRTKYYTRLPVYTGGNAYFNGAKPCRREVNFMEDKEHPVYVRLIQEKGLCRLETNIPQFLPKDMETAVISTRYLGEAFEPEQKFENPDGTPITFDRDYFGEKRGINPVPGPFETEKAWEEPCNYGRVPVEKKG